LHAGIYFPEDNLQSINRILKTIQTPGSLHTVSIRARVGVLTIGEPEILLDADWETFCVEIIRVRSKESFKIMLWMDGPTGMELSDFRDQLNRRCKSILSRLLEEKVASLVNSLGCTNDLSHTINAGDY
jgi:hypothetical protein